jgi:hypothetical protein
MMQNTLVGLGLTGGGGAMLAGIPGAAVGAGGGLALTAAMQKILGSPAIAKMIYNNPAAARGLLEDPQAIKALLEASKKSGLLALPAAGVGNLQISAFE